MTLNVFTSTFTLLQIKRYRTYAYVMRTRGGGAGADDTAPALPERAAAAAHGHNPPP